jgi:hypothetical protein
MHFEHEFAPELRPSAFNSWYRQCEKKSDDSFVGSQACSHDSAWSPGIQEPTPRPIVMMEGAVRGQCGVQQPAHHSAPLSSNVCAALFFYFLIKIPVVSVDTVFLDRICFQRFLLYTHLLDFHDGVCLRRVALQQLCSVFGNHLPSSWTFLRLSFPASFASHDILSS